MSATFCEFCGEKLLEGGHCPWEDCPTNVLLELLEEEGDAEDGVET